MTRADRSRPPRKRGGVKRLIACAVSGALLAAGSVLLPAAALAAETCHGESATVVPDAEGNLGGAGFDRAKGMRGNDLCRAEVLRGCELS